MATPSSGGDSDKAIPQSSQPPSLTESCLQQEDIVDQSTCSAWLQWFPSPYAASDSALLQQELLPGESDKAIPLPPSLPSLRAWLQQEDIVDQSQCFPTDSVLLQKFMQQEDIVDIVDQLLRQEDEDVVDRSPCSASDYALSHPPPSTLGDDEEEEVGTRSEGRGEGEMEEGHLNSAGCLKKGKRKVRSPRGERGNKKTTGARIEISLDDILDVQQMRLEEAAKHLKVSASTLKRVCREHGIHRWPPRMGKNCINQSGPSESLLAVDQEQIAQQRPDTPNTPRSDTPNTPRSDTPNTPRSDMSWSSDTNSVIIKARYVKDCTIKFPLPRPWVMVELEQQVQKRLKLEAGTYYIKYKDEDNDLIIIACDEDLQDYISSSRPRGTTSIEVFLVPK